MMRSAHLGRTHLDSYREALQNLIDREADHVDADDSLQRCSKVVLTPLDPVPTNLVSRKTVQ